MANSIWTPSVSVTLNGSPLTGVTRARATASFTEQVSKAYVQVYPAPAWTEGQSLTVTMGGGTNNALRFTGTVYEGDYINDDPTFELVARGPLEKARRFRNNVKNGLTLQDLTGGPATDQVITRAVLTIAGVPFISGNIGGTGITRGTLAPAAYTWRNGETALNYLARLSQACVGYRLVETIGGDVIRVQVYGRPQGTSVFTLTEGIDIFGGGHTQRETFSKYSAVTINGFDYGDGSGALTFSSPDPTPAGIDPYIFTSDMIERALESDSGLGISAEAVAAWALDEVNRETIRTSSISTPRDDLFGPGQTHTIDSDRLGLNNELLWLFDVTCEANDQWFTQTMNYIGGGSSTGGYGGPT